MEIDSTDWHVENSHAAVVLGQPMSPASPHHHIVERLAERCRPDPDVLALVVIGSVARGEATEHSDVDALAILSDEAFARRFPPGVSTLAVDDLAGGDQVEVRYWPKAHLRAAAAHGPEPARFAFLDALTVFSRDREVDALLPAIPVYPDHERAEKLAAFAAQLPVHLSYLALGDYSENPYLLTDTAHELALFGGRLILTHNRLLYPGRKWFVRQLERAPERPDRFFWHFHRLLRHPCIPTATAFCDAVLGFHTWPEPLEGWHARYLRDRDEAWLWRPAALAES